VERSEALVGIAWQEQYLTSLDQMAAGLLPENSAADAHSRQRTMTTKSVLTMQPGLQWDDEDATGWHVGGDTEVEDTTVSTTRTTTAP
jgi:hypothetical protein